MNLRTTLEQLLGKDLDKWVASLPDELHEAARTALGVMHDMNVYVNEAGKHNHAMPKDQRRRMLTDMRFRMGIVFAALCGSVAEEEANAEDVGRAKVKDALNLMCGVIAALGSNRSKDVIIANLYTAYWRLLDEDNTLDKEDSNEK